MKNILTIALILSLTACGRSSSDNEVVGQIKKVVNKTPIVCSDYTEVHVSLGVMRNGVGSMSTEDITLALDNSERDLIERLKKARDEGAVVKLTYDVERVSPCWPDHRMRPMLIVEAVPPSAMVLPTVEAPKP